MVNRLLGRGTRCLILDLSALSFMDSSGVGLLIRTQNTLAQHHGRLSVVAPTGPVRRILDELRRRTFAAARAPLPALELLIAEMLAIHFCSDLAESIAVLEELLAEVCRRLAAQAGVLDEQAARVFWVNPVADLRAMNLLEQCGGRSVSKPVAAPVAALGPERTSCVRTRGENGVQPWHSRWSSKDGEKHARAGTAD
jgi:hypothetical protein